MLTTVPAHGKPVQRFSEQMQVDGSCGRRHRGVKAKKIDT